MAQAQDPPKWGDWGGQDVEYTAFFESERRGKGPKERRRAADPNDPRWNLHAATSTSSRTKVPVNGIPAKDPGRDGNFHAFKAPPGARVRTSYSGSDGRSGDPSHKRGGSRTSFDGSSHSNASTPWQHLAVRPAKGRHLDAHQKAPSVPAFGSWKGNSTAEQRSVAPEEYSIIFDRVREERDQAGAASRPLKASKMPAEHERNDEETPVATPAKFKWCFCFAA